jgi:hypothetical protein
MADAETIFTGGHNKLSIHMPAIVTVCGSIVFTQDGNVVGNVDAQYDLTGLAPELHELALMMALPRRTIKLATGQAMEIPNSPTPLSVWEKTRRFFYG